MPVVSKVGVDERRRRLAIRHRLAVSAQASTATDVAESLVALHSTDPASVFLAIQARTSSARTSSVDPEAIEAALYRDRSLVRMLGMRRTMFVVPTSLAPVIQAACTDAIATVLRRNYARFLTEAGVGDGDWLDDVAAATERALCARGEATGAQLSADEPRLRTQVDMNPGKSYGGPQNITTWVLVLLAAQGRIVRGRPTGSWTSSQYRWSPAPDWLPGGLSRPELSAAAARVELARRWLAAFGPATAADLRWWTGWTASQVQQALAGIDAVEVDLGGAPGLLLRDDQDPVPPVQPWVALLPALDPTPMGWSQRDWYLGEHAVALFDRSGNISPTVWCDGRVVGAWAQRRDGEVVYRLLDDVGSAAAAQIAAAAARLAEWIGPVRVTARFRTPLERELTG